ncbi:MAG: hypothetical protein Q8N88_02720, partial [Nanoarchaeota archaeon]|nr:hypothetical protein [Nanoarchaeota archaeon]
MCIFLGSAALATVYFFVLSIYFNQLWYHKLFNAFSSIILFLMAIDLILFFMEKKAIDQLPVIIENIINFYQVNQNMISAVEKTKAFFPKYKHLDEMTDAYKNDRKANLPTIWHDTLFFIFKESCEKGTTEKIENDQYSKSLQTLIFNLMDIKSEQDLDNASLLSFQFFSFFMPYIVIIASDMFNAMLLKEMGISPPVDQMQKISVATQLILVGNIGTIFINWMRKVVTV